MAENQSQGKDIMGSLCITQDEKRQIVHAEFFYTRFEDVQQRIHAFAGYIHAELEMYRFADPIPDYHVCQWNFIDPPNAPSRTEFEKDPAAIKTFLEDNKAVCQYSYSLRLLECAHVTAGTAPVERHICQGIYDEMLKDGQIQHRLYTLSQAGNRKKSILAIENDKGILLFPDNSLGECRMNAYLQHVADKYFYPEGKEYDNGKYCIIQNPGNSLQDAMRGPSAFSPFDYHFMPEKAHYLPTSLLLNEDQSMQPLYRVNPSFRGFHAFLLKNPLLGCSHDNFQIMQLLHIHQTGRLEKFSTDLRYKQSFSFRSIFGPLEADLSKLYQQGGANAKQIKQKRQQMSQRAESILHAGYGIIPSAGSPRQEREITFNRKTLRRL